MRVRQEAKIVKNYRREYEYDGDFDLNTGECLSHIKSRYSQGRVSVAHQRLEKAMRRRYRNAARKAWNEGGYCTMFRYYNHKACSEYEIFDDALRWWNIPE